MCLLLTNFYVPYISIIWAHPYPFLYHKNYDQILGSSSSVSESSSAEKSIAGLLSNADEQLRRAREYNNRMAQKMYTHTPDTIYTHSQTSTHTEKACQHSSLIILFRVYKNNEY